MRCLKMLDQNPSALESEWEAMIPYTSRDFVPEEIGCSAIIVGTL